MRRASGLFEPSPLLDWLPDETLFSLVSRLHFFWGTDAPRKTSRILFGTPHSGCLHDFPDQLSYFAQKTREQLGTTESLAAERTLLRYYRLFLSLYEYETALAALSASEGRLLRRRLGILINRKRVQHPLKICPVCMEQDLQQTGWAYWHRQHQYPGVWTCPLHGRFLYATLTPSTVSPTYALPGQFAFNAEYGGLGDEATIHELTLLIVDLVDYGQRIEQKRLLWLYHDRLVKLGLLKQTDVFDPFAVAAHFMRHVQQFHGVPELLRLPETVQASGMQLGQLLQQAPLGTHPLRHMLAISWLWGTAECFWQDYLRVPENPPVDNFRIPTQRERRCGTETAPLRDEFLALLDVAERSVTSMAETLGVSPSTVRQWAAHLNIQLPYHSPTLGEDQLVALKASLREGAEISDVATQFGLSCSAAMRILKWEVGLNESWRQARMDRQRRQSRTSWQAAAVVGDLNAAQVACSSFPTVFQWLYKYDYAWLHEAVMEVAPPPPASEVLSSDVDREDISLYANILIAALRLHLSPDKRVDRMWWICSLVPGLKSSMKQLNRFPRSNQLLMQLIRQWQSHSLKRP